MERAASLCWLDASKPGQCKESVRSAIDWLGLLLPPPSQHTRWMQLQKCSRLGSGWKKKRKKIEEDRFCCCHSFGMGITIICSCRLLLYKSFSARIILVRYV